MSKNCEARSVRFDLQDICKICQENKSKYCCPRCNVTYCSLDCYKSPSHSECSESFYKDCISEEITSMDHDPRSKKVMEEILTKMRETDDPELSTSVMDTISPNECNEFYDENDLDSDDDNSIPDLATRLKNIDLDNSNAVWNILTDGEKKEFQLTIEKDVTHLLPQWEPWWNFHDAKIIVEMDDLKPRYKYEDVCPKIICNIIDFADLTTNPPATCVQYNIINVLGSYVNMARVYQGDHHTLCTEATYCLISLSINLNNNGNFDNLESSVMAVTQESYNHSTLSINTEAQYQIKSDLKCLLTGPEKSNNSFYVQSSLSDIHNLLNKYKRVNLCKKRLGSNNLFSKTLISDTSESMIISKDKIKRLLKKIEYYISYNNSYGNEMCSSISKNVFFKNKY